MTDLTRSEMLVLAHSLVSKVIFEFDDQKSTDGCELITDTIHNILGDDYLQEQLSNKPLMAIARSFSVIPQGS